MSDTDLLDPASTLGGVRADNSIVVESLVREFKKGPRAVDGIDLRVEPGEIYGFLGPNGAGKSTTMRMLLGLDAPTRGRSTIGGRSYATHSAPLTEVGALLEARSVHPGRTAFHHLMALAHTHGIPRSRVEHVLSPRHRRPSRRLARSRRACARSSDIAT